MGVEIKIVTDNFEKVKNMSDEAVIKALTEIGMQVERHAKEKCPVDTGLLRNSITYALDGGSPKMGQYKANKAKGKKGIKSGSYGGTMPAESGGKRAVYVGSNVEYAPYVELGTSKQTAQPFLKPAVQDFKEEYRTIIKKNMENA